MNYEKLLNGKNAVVFDGYSQLGRAIAEKFALHGASVAVGMKDPGDDLLSVLRKHSPDSFVSPCDLGDKRSLDTFCAGVKEKFSAVHVLVINPYAKTTMPLLESSEEDDERLLQIYQLSAVHIMRAFWRSMMDTGNCSVIFISTGTPSNVGNPLSAAANGSLGGFVRAGTTDSGWRELRLNEIMTAQSVYEDALAPCPLKTGGGRPDIECTADTALFFASEMSSYISGVTVKVDGGAGCSFLLKMKMAGEAMEYAQMLKGRRAVVTGGADGVGLAVSRLFAAQGARVAILDNDKASMEAAKAELQASFPGSVALICSLEDVDAACSAALNALGSVDLLVNAAGLYKTGSAHTFSREDFEKMLTVNLRYTIYTTRFFVQSMKDGRRGDIINITSDLADWPQAKTAAIAACAGAIQAFTRNVTMDYIRYHVRANCILYPFGRLPGADLLLGKPDEDAAANAALRFACDLSRFTIGDSLPVNGGQL